MTPTQISITADINKFHEYLGEAYGVRVISSAHLLEIEGREQVAVTGLNETLGEMSVAVLAGIRHMKIARS